MKKTLLSFLIICIPIFLLAYTGEIIQSFDTPGSYPTGLTFDGTNLWLADYQTDKLYAIDPAMVKSLKPLKLQLTGQKVWPGMVKLCGMQM